MQLQRVLNCPVLELESLLRELAVTFAKPQLFTLLRTSLDETLTSHPEQPAVEKQELVEIVLRTSNL